MVALEASLEREEKMEEFLGVVLAEVVEVAEVAEVI